MASSAYVHPLGYQRLIRSTRRLRMRAPYALTLLDWTCYMRLEAGAPATTAIAKGGTMAWRKIVGRKLGWALGLAILVLLPSKARGQAETVKLGDLAAISNAAIYIAIEKGFFKEQGINTEIS